MKNSSLPKYFTTFLIIYPLDVICIMAEML